MSTNRPHGINKVEPPKIESILKSEPDSKVSSEVRPDSRVKQLISKVKKHVIEHAIAFLSLLVLGVIIYTEHKAVFHLEKIAHKMGLTHDGDATKCKPERKRILAVFPDSAVSQPMLVGMGFNGDNERNLEDDVWLERIVESNSVEETLHVLRDELRCENVLMVIGHERSSTASYLNLNLYESLEWEENGPIPLILPAVTNPAITAQQKSDELHILRIPATDDSQVKAISAALKALDAKSIALAVDTSNHLYSKYIAKELASLNPKLPIVDSFGIDLAGLGLTLSSLRLIQNPTGRIGSQSELSNSLEKRVDTVVFAGMEVEAAIFLRNLKFNGARLAQRLEFSPVASLDSDHSLRLIFTDGVAGNTFRTLAQDVLSEGEEILLTAPLPTSAQKGLPALDFPTYEIYSHAAKSLAKQLVASARRSPQGLSRRSILESMRNLTKSDPGVSVPGDSKHDPIQLIFNSRGDNVAGKVHIYTISSRGVTHSRLCAC